MAKIGLYGGTFNPIHNGHVGVCRQAVEQLRLDRLHLIPTFVPPHKAALDLAAGEDRLAMCRLATTEIPQVFVDDFELRRGGVSYTIDTLRTFRQQFPSDDLYLVMGTDNFLAFELWRSWQEIGTLCTLAVASREREGRGEMFYKAGKLAAEGVRSIFLDNPIQVVSSTEIRGIIGSGEPTDLIPQKVQSYILEHDLYHGGKH